MVCIVYDITNKETLKHVGYWFDKIKQFFENSNKILIGIVSFKKFEIKYYLNIFIGVLVGNK